MCGGSASGKTTVARKIIEALDVQWVSLVCMDSFYKVCSLHAHALVICVVGIEVVFIRVHVKLLSADRQC